jgi:hypothetical protein
LPYIKQEYRISPDYIINQVRHGNIVEALSFLIDYIEKLPLEQVDGTINYIFSRLLKDTDLSFSIAGIDLFINGAIEGIYLEDKTYFKLERLIGLLHCMEAEFKERGWKASNYLEKLSSFYYTTVLIPYELKKRKENGDID